MQGRIGQREGDLYRQAQQALQDGGATGLDQASAALPWQQTQLTDLQGEQKRHMQEQQQQQKQQSEAQEAEQQAAAAERNRKDAAARQVGRCSANQCGCPRSEVRCSHPNHRRHDALACT